MARHHSTGTAVGGHGWRSAAGRSLLLERLAAHRQPHRRAGAAGAEPAADPRLAQGEGEEVLAIQGGSGRQIDTSGTLEGVVNRTAFNHKIKIARLQPQAQELQVWIDTVQFDDLLLWLSTLVEQHGIQVQIIEIAREDLAPGLVKVRRLQLSRPQ